MGAIVVKYLRILNRETLKFTFCCRFIETLSSAGFKDVLE
jgi:hypothetical protein